MHKVSKSYPQSYKYIRQLSLSLKDIFSHKMDKNCFHAVTTFWVDHSWLHLVYILFPASDRTELLPAMFCSDHGAVLGTGAQETPLVPTDTEQAGRYTGRW